ncbi:hypothetical protein JCM8547_009017 [Rhodosporidiobolus lusitaniae]
MSRYVTLLTLASAALAAPASVTPNPALSLATVFRTLDQTGWTASTLEKRQSASTSEVLDGLEELLQKAVNAFQTEGECSAPCYPWLSEVVDCTTLSTYEAIGRCACGTSSIQAMRVCGNCFGDDEQEDAEDFGDYCRRNGAGGTYNSTNPSSAVASATGLASGSAYASGTAASRTASGAASRTVLPSSEATVTGAGGAIGGADFGGLNDVATTPSSGESAAASSNPLTGGNNAAGVVKVGAGLAAGVLGGAALLLAF